MAHQGSLRARAVDGRDEPAPAQPFGGGDDVGRPAQHALDLLVGAGHDLAVEPEPAHDEEDLLVIGPLLTLGDLQPLVAGAGQTDVDPMLRTAHHGLRRSFERVEGKAEVASEQVACAGRQQAEGHVGAYQPGGDRAHRAVTPERRDDVGAGRHGVTALPLSGLILGGLYPGRLVPPMALTHVGEQGLGFSEVVDLGRVDHDGESPSGAPATGLGSRLG